MKAIFNWRYFVLYALFMVGVVSLIFISADDERSLGAFIETRLYLALISIMSFYLMNKLRVRWESQGKTPKFINPKYK